MNSYCISVTNSRHIWTIQIQYKISEMISKFSPAKTHSEISIEMNNLIPGILWNPQTKPLFSLHTTKPNQTVKEQEETFPYFLCSLFISFKSNKFKRAPSTIFELKYITYHEVFDTEISPILSHATYYIYLVFYSFVIAEYSAVNSQDDIEIKKVVMDFAPKLLNINTCHLILI